MMKVGGGRWEKDWGVGWVFVAGRGAQVDGY